MRKSKLKKKIAELEYSVKYLRVDNANETKRWMRALNMLCANCDIYQHYGVQVCIQCDYRNCPIYRKVVLFEDE